MSVMKHYSVEVWRPGQAEGEYKLWAREEDRKTAENMKKAVERGWPEFRFRLVEWTGRIVAGPVAALPLRVRKEKV